MTGRAAPIIVVAAVATMLCSLAVVGFVFGLRINLTPSYPIGVWRIEPLARHVAVGDRVFICPPVSPEFIAARERGYLGSGLCPGWMSPLIKTVAAQAGQQVAIGRSVAIDGVHLPHSSVLSADGAGRALSRARGGVVPPGHLFVFSAFSGSYDSRYFGPIPTTGILGLARPVLVLNP